MNYSAYPNYKPSGLPWVGNMPAHWELKKLKYLGDPLIGLTYEPSDVVGPGEGTLVLRSSNIQNGEVVLDDNVYVKTVIPRKLIARNNDILICSRNGNRALVGKNAKIKSEAAGSSFGAFTTVFRSQFNDFLFYVFNSRLFAFQSSRFLTSTINQLTIATLKDFRVPVPPVTEQRQIAAFLDREIRKIDGIIATRQRTRELLLERREAAITESVYKRLDTADWKRMSLKCAFTETLVNGVFKKKDQFGAGTKLVNVFDAYRDDFRVDLPSLDSVELAAGEAERYAAREGDILFVRSSLKREGIARSVLVPEINQPLVFECHLVRGRPNRSVVMPRFLIYLLNCRPVIHNLIALSNTTTMTTIDQGTLSSLSISLPDLPEQQRRVKCVEQLIADTAAALVRIDNHVGLLRDCRVSLITAAVTGQIDVRNYKAQGVASCQ